MRETGPEFEPKPDGERWLELLGYGHLKGQPTGYAIDGVPVMAEDFNLLCDDHVRPVLTGLESLDEDDPRYPDFLRVAQQSFQKYFDAPVEVS